MVSKKENLVKIYCEGCKAENYIKKPFGANKYLIAFIYSACPNCVDRKEK